jgi:FAD/FMN-containing dehydrogenase
LNEIIKQLSDELGAQAVLTGASVNSRSTGLWGPTRDLEAACVIRPADTRGVSRVLEVCNAAGQPVVTHGGLTGTVNGAAAGPAEVVLSLERMRAIEEVDVLQKAMVVQAGAPLEKVQNAADAESLCFPLDLGARGTATIGGNAATNAGGNQVLRFGMMRNMVLGLEAVLADGTIISSMNRMLKNNAGYDVKQLFIGSEGTLGVITRLVLRLVARPLTRDTAMVAVRDFAGLTRLLGSLEAELGGNLNSFEVMWSDFYQFTLSQGGHQSPLPAGYEFYVLIEAAGADPAGDAGRFATALARTLEKGLIADAVIAKSEAERARIWAIRDDVVLLLELEPMFLFDVSLPIRHMESYINEVRRTVTEHWADAKLYTFGHLGDGNLHLAISAGLADGSAREQVEAIVYNPLGPIGGSVSGEHGIGLEKKPFLGICRTEAEIALMKTLKQSLDPNGILNPGKIF